MDEISVESVPSRKWEGETQGRESEGPFSQKQSNLNWNVAQNLGDIKPFNFQFRKGEK